MLSNILEQPLFVKAALASSLLGTALSALGVVITQAGITYTAVNPLGVAWYLVFFAIALNGAYLYSLYTATFESCKTALMALVAVFLGTMPRELALFLSLAASSGTVAVGGGFLSAGFIFLSFSLFGFLIFYGSDLQEPMAQSKPMMPNPHDSSMTLDIVLNNQQTPVQPTPTPQPVPTPVPMTESRARALYACKRDLM